jgi:acetyl esterase
MLRIFTFFSLLCFSAACWSADAALSDAKAEVYKTVGDVALPLYIYAPKDAAAADKRPAIVFFFGGGWQNGSPAQFVEQCKYLASRGMVAITAEYRVGSRHGVKAIDCVRDARAAMRYVYAHAAKLGIDPERIAAGGGSAGGHLAACTLLATNVNHSDDDMSIKAEPVALVLFNPVMALGSAPGLDVDARRMDAWSQRMGCDPLELSPLHLLKTTPPPTIQFFGTSDELLKGAELYAKKAKELGGRCEVVTYKGQNHGFFNFNKGRPYYTDTVRHMDEFLISLGWLKGEPTMVSELDAK